MCVECDVGVSVCVRENVYVTFMMQMTESKLGSQTDGYELCLLIYGMTLTKSLHPHLLPLLSGTVMRHCVTELLKKLK